MAIDRQHAEVALKLRLESDFNNRLSGIYADIINEATEHYANTQEAKNLSVFFASISAVTFLHWLATKRAFDRLTFKTLESSKTFMRLMNKIANIDTTGRTTSANVLFDIRRTATNANTAHMQDWVNSASQSVNDTNQKQLDAIVALGLSATAFREKLKETYSKRIETITATTTQEAAESTKDSIFTSSNNMIETMVPSAKPLRKQWIAVLDDRTRPDHAHADGQIKNMSEPFEVGESLLMYPSDSSLGAPLSQTINCRCVSVVAGLFTF